jgi:chromosome segregation protein
MWRERHIAGGDLVKLNRLEIFGFKSFADRTVFEFDKGMTALVGPNGCGKSNVVDAIKWVLGEQRPTSLRGKEMMDVLFNGTSSRKALGLAEVSVTFDNSDHNLPIDFEEVVVTRRLYRDGGSEFLLNKNPCRLRDIRELFMDTGTGVESYSVMEQGRIDALLQAGPKDRRAIFDEASGISKYKSRRKEAQRKLEKVETNLERLQDVLDITLKRERSVKIQAGRARRFKELTEDLRRMRLDLALHRYRLLLEDRRESVERIDELAAAEAALGGRIRALSEEILQGESGLEGKSARLREAETKHGEAEAGLIAARERIAYARKLAGELDERMARNEKLIERSAVTLDGLRERRETCGREFEAAEVALEAGRKHLEEAESLCRSARETLDGQRVERETLRRDSLAALGQMSNLENRRARVEADTAGLDARLGRLNGRLDETSREEERLAKLALDAEQAAAALEVKLTSEIEGQRRREVGVEAAAAECEELRAGIEELDREGAAARSRRDVLVKLQASRDGISSGVKSVLAAPTAVLSGVKGVVADYLDVEVEHACAVETLLGDRAEAIITETMDDALNAIEYLREGNRGRATFLPLDHVFVGETMEEDALPDRASLPIWARASSDLVRSRNGCGRQLMSALFADAVVVGEMNEARQMLSGGRQNCRIVTGGGDLFEPTGLVSGGDGESGGGLVSRNAEIRELAGIIQNLTARREELAAERERKTRVLQDLRRELEDARSRKAALREARAQRVSEMTRFVSERDRLAEAVQLDRRERETCDEDRTRLRTALEEIERELVETQRTEAETRGRGEALDEEVERAARALAETEEARTERRISIARALEVKRATEAKTAAVRHELAEAKAGREAALTDQQECRERREACDADGDEAGRTLAEMETLRDATAQRIAALRQEADEARTHLKASRERSESLRDEMDAYQRQLQEFRVKESESRVRLEGLIDRVSEECGENIAEVHAEGREEPEDADWVALEEQAIAFKTRLDRLGHVNMDAIQELEELEEKSTFLQNQKDDLVSSRETLLRAIREINDRSRELFLETFTAVREGFRKTFRKLFGGGRADVILEDESDPLECGIEIVARPPGKELRTIGLLSGGERTMAAAALMFSFFGARPTPFVILDEVDAALDEANVDRFLGLVKDHTSRSQFIIITHSRQTMSVANTLYGVTMAESGISRRMVMMLEEAAAVAEPTEGNSLAQGPDGGV